MRNISGGVNYSWVRTSILGGGVRGGRYLLYKWLLFFFAGVCVYILLSYDSAADP